MANPSPALAALLSFIFPGLGQIYAGNTRRGIVWAIPMVLVIVAGILLVLGGTAAVTQLLTAENAFALIIFDLVFFVYHVAATIDAYEIARRQRSGGRPHLDGQRPDRPRCAHLTGDRHPRTARGGRARALLAVRRRPARPHGGHSTGQLRAPDGRARDARSNRHARRPGHDRPGPDGNSGGQRSHPMPSRPTRPHRRSTRTPRSSPRTAPPRPTFRAGRRARTAAWTSCSSAPTHAPTTASARPACARIRCSCSASTSPSARPRCSASRAT